MAQQQIERSASGLIFEAVYGGVHDVAACEIVGCPCQALKQPFPSEQYEAVVLLLVVERGITIEQARAVLKDW